MRDLSDPIPAATLILMRPDTAGAPEILMLERTETMVFAAGALVFPGGRIDPDDHATASTLGSGLDDAPARIAAIRETIEETGLAPALLPPPGDAASADLREGIASGDPFVTLLERHGLSLDLAALTPFARWCPNFREQRRFDALFFLAESPPETAHAEPARAEATRLLWATAREILDEIDAGRAHAIFPTRRNLERLAEFGSLDEAIASAERFPVRKITPWVEERGGRRWVCIPEDAGYPVTAEPLETARRS